MSVTRRLVFLALWTFAITSWDLAAQTNSQLAPSNTNAAVSLQSGSSGIWENGVGEGFRSTAQSLTLAAGATYGMEVFGGRQRHDLALASLAYGHMLGNIRGRGHWYEGNPEIRLEAFTGAQFSPTTQWLVGLTPHLRYNFATGTRVVPFIDLGAGVSATGIGHPDLSGTFEFNLQAGTGAHWFLRDNLALTIEGRFMHMSDASISKPNLGLNGITGLAGVTLFF